MRHLDLFSGIGGFALAAQRVGWETIAFCDKEPFAQQVLAKHWPDVPCYPDVKELKGSQLGSVDIITGGYPCQGESVAGKRRGKADDRWLWPEMFRLIMETNPRWVLGENVANHVRMGLKSVLSDLASAGYEAFPFVIPACALDAPHRRDRVWVIGYRTGGDGPAVPNPNHRHLHEDETVLARWHALISGCFMEDPQCLRRGQMEQPIVGGPQSQGAANPLEYSSFPGGWKGWPVEPGVGRVAHGVSNRVDRLRGLGNAIVPEVALIIFQAIAFIEAELRQMQQQRLAA